MVSNITPAIMLQRMHLTHWRQRLFYPFYWRIAGRDHLSFFLWPIRLNFPIHTTHEIIGEWTDGKYVGARMITIM